MTIAVIVIGGFYAVVLVAATLIVTIICWRHYHAKRRSNIITQQPDQQMLIESNPPGPLQTPDYNTLSNQTSRKELLYFIIQNTIKLNALLLTVIIQNHNLNAFQNQYPN